MAKAKPTCPSCNSEEVSANMVSKLTWLLSFFITYSGASFSKKKIIYHCFDCHKDFEI